MFATVRERPNVIGKTVTVGETFGGFQTRNMQVQRPSL